MKGFEIPAVLMNPPRFRKDKGVTVAFESGEMTTEQKMLVLANEGSIGTLVYIPEAAQDAPPKLENVVYEGKKPSQRLYNVMFIYWKQQGSKGSYEEFYNSEMEKIINSYKDKLDNF